MATVTAIPPTLDLNLYAGDDLVMTLTIKEEGEFPYDLTGTVLAQIRKGHALELVALFTTTVTDPTEGIVVMTLTADDTAALGEAGGHHSWDLQHTDTDGFITSLCRGAVTTTLDITQVGVA